MTDGKDTTLDAIAAAAERDVAGNLELDSASTEQDLGEDLDTQRWRYEAKRLQQELDDLKLLEKLREEYTPKLFEIVTCWLITVLVTVLLSGFGVCGFNLDASVLIAFITSSTASVLALFGVAARWIYPSKAASRR